MPQRRRVNVGTNRTKSNTVTKVTKAAEAAAQEAAAAPAPAPEPVVEQTEADTTEAVATEPTAQATETKTRKPRARNRPFAELHAEMSEHLTVAYKNLQHVFRSFGSLATAYKREVTTKVRREGATTRTPTASFDKALCDYLTSRLDASELVVNRKNGAKHESVDLSALNPDTRLFRTDLTQLYNRIFVKHGIANEKDHRIVEYSRDSDLVSLLTTGDYDKSLESEMEKIRAGNFKLTIFSIQRFLNQHITNHSKQN